MRPPGERPDDAVAPTMAADAARSPTLAAPPGAAPAAPAPAALPADDARYAVGELLGRGGMGEVRLARDQRIGRDVAIKTLRADAPSEAAVARFLREARVQGRLDHPAVVPVHDLGVGDDGRPFFAMKRVAGTTLAAIIERLAAGDPDAAARWPRRVLLQRLADLCLAIEYAHARGVIHRDLKPANIVLGDYGEVYVLDWGIARIAHDDAPAGAATIARDDLDTAQPASDATAAGAVLGTPGYMAPEQVRGEPIDARADVYALGCVLYELLALAPALPRGAAGLDAALTAGPLAPGDRAPDADIPPELDDACRAATAPAPADRLPSARALHDRLHRYLDGDRDLARRRELAAGHAAAAARLLADGDRGRAGAMREAGRALALDPTHAAAQAIVSRLLLEPPDATPAEVTRALAVERAEAGRRQLRQIALVYLVYLAFIPAVLYLGVRDGRPLAVIAGMVAFNMAMAWWGSRHGEPRRVVLLAFVTESVLVATIGTIYSPLLLMPIVAMATTTLFLLHPSGRDPALAIAAGVATMTVPILLEVAGVLPRTFAVEDGALVIRPWAVGVDAVGLIGTITVGAIGAVLATAALVLRLRRAQAHAEERLHVQAWQLRQLVAAPDPTAAPGAPTAPPTAAPPPPSRPRTRTPSA